MILFSGYGLQLLDGAWLTMQVAIASLVIATLLGFGLALMRGSRIALIRGMAFGYTTVVRSIPELVLMLLVFFGGQMLLNQALFALGSERYIDINPFFAGTLTLGVIFAAYMGETFRGAILAVERGQLEAARALGMRPYKVVVRVLIPQMVRHALPSFTNNWLVLLKSTALVSVIGLEDMVRTAQVAGNSSQQPFVFFIAVAAIFLVFSSASLWALGQVARRYQTVLDD